MPVKIKNSDLRVINKIGAKLSTQNNKHFQQGMLYLRLRGLKLDTLKLNSKFQIARDIDHMRGGGGEGGGRVLKVKMQTLTDMMMENEQQSLT